MIIHLSFADQHIVDAVRTEILLKAPDATIHTDEEFVHSYIPGKGEHILLTGSFEGLLGTTVESRWADLNFARLGGRLWTDEEELTTASYAGKLSTGNTAQQIVIDAAYAEGRAQFFDTLKVNYLGRVFVDPRTVVVLDNKLDNPELHPDKSEIVGNILASLPNSDVPENSYSAIGLVTASSVKRLEKFLWFLSETNTLSVSKGASNRLEKLGRDYIQLPKPTSHPDYGIELRNASTLLKPALPELEPAEQ